MQVGQPPPQQPGPPGRPGAAWAPQGAAGPGPRMHAQACRSGAAAGARQAKDRAGARAGRAPAQVRPQEVHVHLQLLQARAAQRLQPHALHQALEARARDACAAAPGAAHGAAGPAACSPARSRSPPGAWCASPYPSLPDQLAADLVWRGH